MANDRFAMTAIRQIAERAKAMAQGTMLGEREMLDWVMDLDCVHASTPLRLEALLAADSVNFAHDVFGIATHLDRTSGHLKDCFVPRFTA